jgi:ankyrin repeat protein
MKTIHKNTLKASCIGLLGIVLLIGCTKSGSSESYKRPITQSMIDMAENMPGAGSSFLGNVLRKLQAGEAVDINAKNANDNDNTALHYAAMLGAPRILQALIDRGADVNAKANDSGWRATPLLKAIIVDKPCSVTILLQTPDIDVSPTLYLPADTDAHGATPLIVAVLVNRSKNFIDLLLQDSRTEVNKKNNAGKTALALAQAIKGTATTDAGKKRWQEIIDAITAKGGTV